MKFNCVPLIAICSGLIVKGALADSYLVEDVLMVKRSAIDAGARAIEKLIARQDWPGPNRLVGTVISVESESLAVMEQFVNVNDPIMNSKRVVKIAVRWPPNKHSDISFTMKGRFHYYDRMQDALNRRAGNVRVSMDPFLPGQTFSWNEKESAEGSGIFEQIEVLPANWADGLADLGAGIQALRGLDHGFLLKSCVHSNAIVGNAAFALLLADPKSTKDEVVSCCEAGIDDDNIAVRTVLGLKSRSAPFAEGLKRRASTVTDASVVDGMALGCYVALRYGHQDVVREIDRIAAYARFGKTLDGDPSLIESLRDSPAINVLLSLREQMEKENASIADDAQKRTNVVEMLANAMRVPQAFGSGEPKR